MNTKSSVDVVASAHALILGTKVKLHSRQRSKLLVQTECL